MGKTGYGPLGTQAQLLDPALKKIMHNDALRDLTGPLLYRVLKELHAGSSDSAKMDLSKDWKALACSEATLDDFLAKLDQLIVDSEQQGCENFFPWQGTGPTAKKRLFFPSYEMRVYIFSHYLQPTTSISYWI